MTIIPAFAALVVATISSVAAAQPIAIDKQSPFFRGLMAAPVPTQVDRILYVRDVLRFVGDQHRASRVHIMAERAAVGAMLGQAPEPAPRRVSDVPDLPPYSDVEFDKLRAEALKRSIGEVANAKHPTPQHRTFRNLSAVPVTGFHVIVSEPKGTSDIQCRYEGLLAPQETVDRVCPGYSGPRLTNVPAKVTWVRVEPGAYEIKDGKGVFGDTSAKTRARLAQLTPDELRPLSSAAPPAGDAMGDAMLQGFAQIFLYVAGPAVLLGLLLGAFHPRPKETLRAIHIIAAVLAVVAGLAGFMHWSGGGGGGGGLLLILSFFLVIGATGIAIVVWCLFILGLWLGFAFGYAMRRIALIRT